MAFESPLAEESPMQGMQSPTLQTKINGAPQRAEYLSEVAVGILSVIFLLIL
jgi:hypothetical protein